ncbi:MAG: hypothetical protein U0414_12290 [Polyangiaceae bacterium]
MVLEPCAVCRRHVLRASDCPFCLRRRASLGVALAAVSVAVAACGGADSPGTSVPTSDPTTPTTSAPTSTTGSTGATPNGGATAVPTSPTAEPPDDRMRPMYGVSAP